jgi:hypothetical protein
VLSRPSPEPPRQGLPAPLYATAPYAVPDTDALRRAALAASWQRDRKVGASRIRWRWALWAAIYLGLPLLLGLLLFLLAVLHQPQPEPGPAAAPETRQAPPPDADMPALRLDTRFGAPPAPAAPAPQADRPDEPAPLILQPDDWLHSKEP